MPHTDYPTDRDMAQHPSKFLSRPKCAHQHVRSHGNRWHVELHNGPGPCYRLWITRLGPHDDPPIVDHAEDPGLFIAKDALADNHCWAQLRGKGQLRHAIRAAIERSQP